MPLAAQQTQATEKAETGEKPTRPASKRLQIDSALGQDLLVVKRWLPPIAIRAEIFDFNATMPALNGSI